MKIKNNDKSVNIICRRKFKKLQKKFYIYKISPFVILHTDMVYLHTDTLPIRLTVKDVLFEHKNINYKNELLKGDVYFLCKDRMLLKQIKKVKNFIFSNFFHMRSGTKFDENQIYGYMIFEDRNAYLKWKLKK